MTETLNISGKCSWFGGPDDSGVAPDEGLAFFYSYDEAKHLFLSYQPIDPETGRPTTGLARRLNVDVPYFAVRWDYEQFPKEFLRQQEMALITNPRNGKQIKAYPSDWGPHHTTNRICDVSPKVMSALGLETDDHIELVFPFTSRSKTLPYHRICISSGHGAKVGGASGILVEVPEARRVTDALAEALADRGVEVLTFHDNESVSQSENLERITDWHNEQDRELDISVHFNAFEPRDEPVGTEVWYVTQSTLAANLSAAVAAVGFIDRGAKYSKSLWFLNQTMMPSVLLEICFVDSTADANLYTDRFDRVIDELATVLGGPAEAARVVDDLDDD